MQISNIFVTLATMLAIAAPVAAHILVIPADPIPFEQLSTEVETRDT